MKKNLHYLGVLGLSLLLTACNGDHKSTHNNTPPQAMASSFHTQADTAYSGKLHANTMGNDNLSSGDMGVAR